MPASTGTATGLIAARYQIERVLGEGATAIVYLARDIHGGRLVAMKVLRAELADSAANARFLREIKRTSSLQHPRILPVLDSGEHDGRPYFVLPYMDGGTLRRRLKRENQLDISEAIAITRAIAEALDHAHERGLIHRDVKPENILFTGGEACLGDFGIARALETVYGDTVSTSANVVRGTPAYMSPEQAAGNADLDGRSDQYSLACVFYEMVTGMQAFMGPTPESVIAQRFAHDPRPLRVYRPAAPAALEVALAKALAMAPADRYRTTNEFVIALDLALTGDQATQATYPRRWRSVAAVLGVMVLASAIIMLRARSDHEGQTLSERATLDSMRYAVVADVSSDSGTASLIADLTSEALARWRGIHVVDAFHVRDAVARSGAAGLPSLRRAAAMTGAGRVVRIETARLGDFTRVTAAVYDTRSGATLARHTLRLSADLAQVDERVSGLVENLLFDRAGSGVTGHAGTVSVAARQAYVRGLNALEQWELDRADSAFQSAQTADPQFVQASLWLAQVRSWKREPAARWLIAAENALAAAARLPARDSIRATALVALARDERDAACGYWRSLAAADAYDFSAWYSLGSCLRFDGAVVQDARSPSGWRFRSSYNEALAAYERAFRLLPSIHRSFRGGASEDVRRLFLASGEALRVGQALPPDTMRFLAYPAWNVDSLAFVPLPAGEFHAAREWTASPKVNEAIVRQRRRFYDLAQMWRAAFPASVDAIEIMAAALDAMGDPAALDTLHLARVRASDPDDRIRTGAAEVFTRLKYALPSDSAGIWRARNLADSLLAQFEAVNDREARLVGSLAALTGRAARAAHFARQSERTVMTPGPLASSGPALVLFAAMGGPADSIHHLEQVVTHAMRSSLPADGNRARFAYLVRAASLALPEHRFEMLPLSRESDSYRVRLLGAVSRSNRAEARRILDDLQEQRRRAGVPAAEIAPDGLYAEAAVLAVLGDSSGAAMWLDRTLDSLSRASAYDLVTPARAAALVRAMSLRASLGGAARGPDWARAVAILWSDADPFLRPLVARHRATAAAASR